MSARLCSDYAALLRQARSSRCQPGHAGWFIVHVCAASLLYIAAPEVRADTAQAAPNGRMTREEVVAVLRHSEEVMRSIRLTWTFTSHVTAPANVPLITEVCTYRGTPELVKRYIVDAAIVARKARTERWLQTGPKEHVRVTRAGDKTPGGTHASAGDGAFYRSLSRAADGSPSGSIQSYSTHPHTRSERLTPLAVLTQYGPTRLSDVIERARDVAMTDGEGDERGWTIVTATHPDYDDLRCAVAFDRNGRITRRDGFRQEIIRGHSRMVKYERLEFKDYEFYADDSGEEIWYPRRILHRRHVGELPNGDTVEYEVEEMNVTECVFNEDFLDDQFVIQFPADAKVFDGDRREWINGTATPITVARGLSVKVIIAANIVACALLVLTVWYRQRARRAV